MRKKYSCYEYSTAERKPGEWDFEIYTNCPDYIGYMRSDVLDESDEWYETEQEAEFAAIGRINELENGPDED